MQNKAADCDFDAVGCLDFSFCTAKAACVETFYSQAWSKQTLAVYTPMAYNVLMEEKIAPQTVAEMASYIKSANAVWDEETQVEFKNYISLNPEAGDIIPGTGGIRKIRWQSSGHGKRGGSRVIYYVYNEDYPIYLLYVYPKNVQVNLSEKEKKLFANVVSAIKEHIRKKEGRL